MNMYNSSEELALKEMHPLYAEMCDEDAEEDDELKPDPEEQAMYEETSAWNDKFARKEEEYKLTKGE